MSSQVTRTEITIVKIKSQNFVVFDKDRSGFASSSEIKTVMANLGVHFTDEEIQEMMIEVSLSQHFGTFNNILTIFYFRLM